MHHSHLKRLVITIGCLWLLGIFIGWMFGYDFNHRNRDTGTFTLVWILFSTFISTLTLDL